MTWVAPGRTPASPGKWLDSETARRLERRLDTALRRARASGAPVLASVTGRADAAVDPTAAVVASRRSGETWFCLEQPDREGSALAAVGSARVLEARGGERFGDVGRAWSTLAAAALADDVAGRSGSVGGFRAGFEGRARAWAHPPARGGLADRQRRGRPR